MLKSLKSDEKVLYNTKITYLCDKKVTKIKEKNSQSTHCPLKLLTASLIWMILKSLAALPYYRVLFIDKSLTSKGILSIS